MQTIPVKTESADVSCLRRLLRVVVRPTTHMSKLIVTLPKVFAAQDLRMKRNPIGITSGGELRLHEAIEAQEIGRASCRERV